MIRAERPSRLSALFFRMAFASLALTAAPLLTVAADPPRAPLGAAPPAAQPQGAPPVSQLSGASSSAPASPQPAPVSVAPRPQQPGDDSGESSVSQPSSQGGDSNPAESLLKLRDPFKRPDAVVEDSAPKSDLELYASHQFILVGVMTGPREMRALIQSPSGKTFFLKRGDHIGQRKGIVEKITPDKMAVQEKIVNVLGQAENITTEIKLTLAGKGGMSLYSVGSKPGETGQPGQGQPGQPGQTQPNQPGQPAPPKK